VKWIGSGEQWLFDLPLANACNPITNRLVKTIFRNDFMDEPFFAFSGADALRSISLGTVFSLSSPPTGFVQ